MPSAINAITDSFNSQIKVKSQTNLKTFIWTLPTESHFDRHHSVNFAHHKLNMFQCLFSNLTCLTLFKCFFSKIKMVECLLTSLKCLRVCSQDKNI